MIQLEWGDERFHYIYTIYTILPSAIASSIMTVRLKLDGECLLKLCMLHDSKVGRTKKAWQRMVIIDSL